MEKYGCNRIEELDLRIKEIENKKIKTASDNDEMLELAELKEEIKRLEA